MQIGQNITIRNTTISANGEPPEANNEQSGGGSGGSIYLSMFALLG